ncbi:MAG: hypothetical protein AAF320_05855 [Myxococcota bacterium]
MVTVSVRVTQDVANRVQRVLNRQGKHTQLLEDQIDGLLAELSKRESAGHAPVPFEKLCQES